MNTLCASIKNKSRFGLAWLTIVLLVASTPLPLNAGCCYDGQNCDLCPPDGWCLCWTFESWYDTGFDCGNGQTYVVVDFYCNTYPFGYYSCLRCCCYNLG